MRGVGATRVSRFMGTGKKVTPSTQAAIELKPVPGLFAITRVMRQMQIARPELGLGHCLPIEVSLVKTVAGVSLQCFPPPTLPLSLSPHLDSESVKRQIRHQLCK